MEKLTSIFLFTRADSIGSVIVRGIVWLILVLIIAYGIDSGHNYKKIKADAGWFILFLFTLGIVTYMLFGFTITF